MVLSLVLISGCEQSPPTQESTIVPEASKRIPVESFVFIKSDMEYDLCSPMAKTCKSKVAEGSGSAVLIAKSEEENLSVVMTAGHICDRSENGMSPYQALPGVWMIPTNFEIDFTLRDFHGTEYKVVSHVMSEEFDLCLMSLRGVIPFDPIEIAQEDVERGDKVFNFASPDGIWTPRNVPIFEGYHTGRMIKGEKVCYEQGCPIAPQDFSSYTIPALEGSSGSPIINDNFELISIVVIVPSTKQASHICGGTTLNDIQGFVDEKLPLMLVNPDTY